MKILIATILALCLIAPSFADAGHKHAAKKHARKAAKHCGKANAHAAIVSARRCK